MFRVMASRRVLFTTIFLLGGCLAMDAIFCQATLFVPRRDPGPIPTGFANVSITARDGVKLEAWFRAQEGGNCVMILHGIGDSRRSSAGFAPMFLTAGYSVLTPDLRGHGTSGGDMVTYGLREKYDVLAWNTWLREHGCRRLYGLGESMGAAILIQSAALTPEFSAIVAESAYSSLRSIAQERIGQMAGFSPALIAPPILETSLVYARLRYGVVLSQVSPRESIRHAQAPILLIHGLADDRTPPWHSQALAEANQNAQLWLVPGARHTGAYATAPDEFQRRVLAWFAEHSEH